VEPEAAAEAMRHRGPDTVLQGIEITVGEPVLQGEYRGIAAKRSARLVEIAEVGVQELVQTRKQVDR
jgi:hypothetical protein